jgi:hypothetical protein
MRYARAYTDEAVNILDQAIDRLMDTLTAAAAAASQADGGSGGAKGKGKRSRNDDDDDTSARKSASTAKRVRLDDDDASATEQPTSGDEDDSGIAACIDTETTDDMGTTSGSTDDDGDDSEMVQVTKTVRASSAVLAWFKNTYQPLSLGASQSRARWTLAKHVGDAYRVWATRTGHPAYANPNVGSLVRFAFPGVRTARVDTLMSYAIERK